MVQVVRGNGSKGGSRFDDGWHEDSGYLSMKGIRACRRFPVPEIGIYVLCGRVYHCGRVRAGKTGNYDARRREVV